MWYFCWILGITSALAFGIINVMWYEAEDSFKDADDAPSTAEKTDRA